MALQVTCVVLPCSLTQAHCHFVVLRAFYEAIQNADVCPANLTILNALCSLYAVYGIVQYSGEFTLVSDCLDIKFNSHSLTQYLI